MKTIKKRKCPICLDLFEPDPRTAKHQKFCSKDTCQKERKRRKWRRWAARNLGQKNLKIRLWAKSYPNYWRHYRRTHPEYVKRDNHRRCLKLRKQRCSAKQTLIKNACSERIKEIQNLEQITKNSAKQTLMFSMIKKIAEYLILKEYSAKHTHMELAINFYGQ